MKRFRQEVRIARQIAHPNVCRVYDIGEADGLVFLSMEYIAGEDLSSLLRRIGRLPPDKAVEIAQQLAFGLAAAHVKGVLHRDLKPANVMLDERGEAKITDFGLAAAVGSIEREDIRSGTPGYMAPEQRVGQEVTEKSDLYSLGLVLYELFTGKRAFDKQQDTTPTRPSSWVTGINPSVERVILKCLEKEPKTRPASALAVRGALPGGDPLAAAIAAGETPAPELVAEGGDFEGLTRRTAWIALIAGLAGIGLAAYLASQTQLGALTPLPKAPAVLVDDAREVLEGLGYASATRDSAHGFYFDRAYIDSFYEDSTWPSDWSFLRTTQPSAVRFEPVLPAPLSANRLRRT